VGLVVSPDGRGVEPLHQGVDCGDSWHDALAMTDAVRGKTSKSS